MSTRNEREKREVDARPALLGVEPAGGHGEDVARDGVEYLEGVAGGAYADVGEGGVLHGGRRGGVMGREGAALGAGTDIYNL